MLVQLVFKVLLGKYIPLKQMNLSLCGIKLAIVDFLWK